MIRATVSVHSDSQSNGHRLVDFEGSSFGYRCSDLLSEARHVVGKDGCFMAGTRDNDIADAGIKHVRMDAGIGVNQDPLGGESLYAVTGDGVAVIEKLYSL